MTYINNKIKKNNNLSIYFYIKSALSLKYISNLSIIICFLSYYMNAFEIFFVFVPLVIVNLILIILIQLFDYDKLMYGILKDIIPDKEQRDEIIPLFTISLNIWHIWIILWLIYILKKDDIIKLFHPNYLDIFLKTLILPAIYYYYEIELKPYGDINYNFYLILYITLIFLTCMYLYK